MDPPTPQQTTTTTTTPTASNGGPKDPTTIVIKRKRTKRQRPNININNINNINNNLTHSSTSYNALTSSPASYSNSPATTTTTTAEDEDTAKCLILLSKGRNININISPLNNNNNNNNNTEEFSGYKFNSKRLIQTYTDSINGSTGIYVYECKTCSRTFSSFQALGGHRASHKKPRLINEFDLPKPPPQFSYEDDASPPQLNHRVSPPGNPKKSSSSSKLHECSICGSEFNSGQALGGHMRRHRAANGNNGNNGTNTTLSLIPYSYATAVVADDHDINRKSRNESLCLDLDLNLPAPPETARAVSDHDQHREPGFKLTANQNKQKPSVHLSAAPTLVDCHY